MSVHFISGKPGGGKSFYAMKLIVDELVLGSRVVVTNVPIRRGELSAYLQEKYPRWAGDLISRLRLLDETETAQFWCYRSPEGQLPEDNQGRPDFSAAATGNAVLYVIDEIHQFFNAREWQKTGKVALYYLSQHRKLGDDVVCITQSIGNVDKQFRSVAQDFTYVRNHSKEKFWGMRKPGFFSRKTYLEPHTGAPGQEATESGHFRLDMTGLAKCYDTAAGVGIQGRSADTGAPKRGVSVLWLLPVIIAAGVLLMFAPRLIASVLVGAVNTGSKAATGALSNPPPKAAQPSEPTAPMPAKGQGMHYPTASPGQVDQVDQVETNQARPVVVNGWLRVGTNSWATLSDGRILSESDPNVLLLASKAVFMRDGTVYQEGEAILPARPGKDQVVKVYK